MIIPVIFVVLLLIILGDSYPKIALSIAALIFLGAMLFNTDSLSYVLNYKVGGGGRK